MPERPFINYLLKLATDAFEVVRFGAGGDVARDSMAAAGLTDPGLQDILLGGDQQAIEEAAAAEHAGAEVPLEGTVLAVRSVVMITLQTESQTEPPSDE
jgi:hypothetical protein